MKTLTRLDVAATVEAVERAAVRRAQTTIQSTGRQALNGVVLTADSQVLLIQLTGNPPFDVSSLQGHRSEVRILAEQHYAFDATVTGVFTWGVTRAVAVTRPQTMALIERRQVRRASLAPSSTVTLGWNAGDVSTRHSAPLLNVSTQGLACRLSADLAASVPMDDYVSLSFRMPGDDQPFVMRASINNKTPASEGFTILGLQFAAGPESAESIQRLRKRLNEPRPVATEMEVCK